LRQSRSGIADRQDSPDTVWRIYGRSDVAIGASARRTGLIDLILAQLSVEGREIESVSEDDLRRAGSTS